MAQRKRATVSCCSNCGGGAVPALLSSLELPPQCMEGRAHTIFTAPLCVYASVVGCNRFGRSCVVAPMGERIDVEIGLLRVMTREKVEVSSSA